MDMQDMASVDTPEHLLLHCPALMGVRLRHLERIKPTPEEVWSGGVVHRRFLQNNQAT